MIDEAAALFDGFGDAPRVVLRRGVFSGVGAGVAWVDMGTSRFACDWGTGYVPTVGETVQVLTVNDRHMLFPSRALPGTGVVMTTGANMVTVQTIAGTFTMPFIGTAPTSGALVGISWSETPFVIGALSVQPKPLDPVPNPGGGTLRSATFQAIDTGSTDRLQVRWWTGQPRAGNSTFGAWFYGTQIRDTIPAGATLVSLQFFASWQQRKFDAPRFALHDQAVKAGIPAFGAYTAWAPGDGWQTPPMADAWFAALKAGVVPSASV
ncbi:hypothetical protein [Microbacterium maritypicum]|uniref:Uncharacterized protein n=1 Tax=Microbacterium maritypicum TaxID=33918 RepID=A0ACD4B8E4_MICMQ|nr:hypothetical protein [Microbacterium liquefaciens]UTT53818.1 hypothetical protein NMQ05_04345 [Microbacterium liquefaciens]